jgi:putative Mn2+ efflux pump MntP
MPVSRLSRGCTVIQLIALVLPLSLDTFAISAAIGMLGLPRAQKLRLSLVLAGFEAGMPLFGVAIGEALGSALGSPADYVASAALIGLGMYLLLSDGDERRAASSLARAHGAALLGFGIAVSLDELAIGFSLGLLDLPVAWTIVLLAAQAFVAAQIGLALGARVGERVREAAERVAGLALLALGMTFLAQAAI